MSLLAASASAAVPTVPAKLAYDCITSVPFNSSAATELLDSIRPYLDWQSTVDYIRDPPAEYAEKIQEPYDFYAEFERIYSTAKSDGYENEFAFGFDLYEAVSSLCYCKPTRSRHRKLKISSSRSLTMATLSTTQTRSPVCSPGVEQHHSSPFRMMDRASRRCMHMQMCLPLASRTRPSSLLQS